MTYPAANTLGTQAKYSTDKAKWLLKIFMYTGTRLQEHKLRVRAYVNKMLV